jgi:DNA helicase HerA-like ATPase
MPLPTSAAVADEVLTQLERDSVAAGGPVAPDPDEVGAVGRTMFDQPGSEDLTITVLLFKENLQAAPSQALVRVKSRPDGRSYLGVISSGPFAQPDSLRADSPLLVTMATRGSSYLPPYHGRVQVTILGEELSDGTLSPPRLRPLPNSPVFALSDEESATRLRCGGDTRLGLAVGQRAVTVGVPSNSKAVLPRHTAVLGTTGGGKSTTVAGLVQQAQAAGMAVVLLDVEGEYAFLHEPTEDATMLGRLRERGLPACGVPAERMALYHLVGRDTANPGHPSRRMFSLQFARLSPYAVMEILDLSDAQRERYLKAYDIAREVMRELGVFPKKGDAEQERLALEVDEFERGYPRMTLPLLMDVVSACAARAEKQPKESKRVNEEEESEEAPTAFEPRSRELGTSEGTAALRKRIHAMNPPGNVISWRALLGRLGRLNRLKVFYDEANGVRPLSYKALLEPGNVSVVDLSDTGFSELNNLVIADLLRGIQEAQDEAYVQFEQGGAQPPRVLVIVEEAHEFLSEERVARTPILFQQVARIAKRGRKRWLGLVFVTQLPQHLPRQLFGLVNNYVLHKITDPAVVGALRRTVSGIDEGLWERLPGLAPGQAIVSFGHMARPLLVAVDPAPCKLRLVD